MFNGLTTPGSKSSEFLLTILNAVVQLILALTDVLSNGTAARLGVIGTVAYVLSRGLAKYEGRPSAVVAAPPVVTQAPPPQA
jgi:hypothetical protein